MTRSTTLLLSLTLSLIPHTLSSSQNVVPTNSFSHRQLSYEAIAGYEPSTQVTDHAAIDLDMYIIKEALDFDTDDAFGDAEEIYRHGGHSKSYAELTLDTSIDFFIAKGTELRGISGRGEHVYGKAMKDVEILSQKILFQYATSNNQEEYVSCRVGSLPVGNRQMSGCLQSRGTIRIDNTDHSYMYEPDYQNKNGRTIRGFSIQAEEKMDKCESSRCPYQDFLQYKNYYGRSDYGDHFIYSALSGQDTSFTNGNAFFKDGAVWVQGSECAAKGMVTLNILMYVIREMEDALDDCDLNCPLQDCNDDPVHAWDEAVAFYTGSLQGKNAGVGDGVLLYALADKRCASFKTCGSTGNELSGGSYVNTEIFEQFKKGQFNLQNKQCANARLNKERIVNLMNVPLIQSVLRYAYRVSNPPVTLDENYIPDMSKENAEGAAYAAAILPKIHKCNPTDAATIYANMALKSETTDFATVKRALEHNYNCLGVTCENIGGIALGDQYQEGARPCRASRPHFLRRHRTATTIVGSFVVLGTVAAVAYCIMTSRSKDDDDSVNDDMFRTDSNEFD